MTTAFGRFGRTKVLWRLLGVLFAASATQAVLREVNTLRVSYTEGIAPCKPTSKDEISRDENVWIMFATNQGINHRYEEFTRPYDYADVLMNVGDGQQILAGFLTYIFNKIIVHPVTDLNKYKTFLSRVKAPPLYGPGLEKQKWPFKCWDAELLTLYSVLIDSLTSFKNSHEFRFRYSMIISFPTITKYSRNVPRQPFSEICSVIRGADQSNGVRGKSLDNIKTTMRAIAALAKKECDARHVNGDHFYCKFDALLRDVTAMRYDYDPIFSTTGSKAEIEKYAMFWLFDSALATHCGNGAYNLQEFQQEILNPLAQLALGRLKEIIGIPSTSEQNGQKILKFIDDYWVKYFTSYAKEMDMANQIVQDGMKSVRVDFIWDKKPNEGVVLAIRPFVSILSEIKTLLISKDSNIDVNEVHALARLASIWFLHPDFNLGADENYNTFLQGITYLLKRTPTLVKVAYAVKSYRGQRCGPTQTTPLSLRFCNLYELLVDLQTYAGTITFTPKTKIINAATDYKKILELDATTGTMFSNIEALEIGQKKLQDNLFNLRSSLGAHFHQLATFDEGKAGHDVVYLEGKMKDFAQRIKNVGLDQKLSKLFLFALEANVMNLAQLALELATALTTNANPLKWMTQSGGANEIMDRVNALAKAGVDTVKLVVIKEEILPELVQKASDLQAANEKNAGIHKNLLNVFNQLKEEKEINIDDVQSTFLASYGNYDPGYYRGDITAYTALLNQAIERLCEILYGGSTATAAVVEAIGASKAICLKTQTNAEVVGDIHEEIYDFQYAFMDAMADAMRALVAKHSATTVENVPTVDDGILLNTYVSRIKLQSKQHVLVALKDVCDVSEYKNGGVPTEQCERALKSQTFANIVSVIANPATVCSADDIRVVSVRIPAKLNPEKKVLEPGVIDLTQLYSGNPTKFTIPFSMSTDTHPNWVHNFVSPTLPVHKDIGLYLRRFELFLPRMSQATPYEVEITVKQFGSVKVLQGDASQKYAFAKPKVFTLNYEENARACPNGLKKSAYSNLCKPKPLKICVSSKGVMSGNELALPLFSTWFIRAFFAQGLSQPQPSPDSPFYLRATMETCTKNTKNIDLSTAIYEAPIKKILRKRCCKINNYWYIDPVDSSNQECRSCPANSFAAMGGLYCDVIRENLDWSKKLAKTNDRKKPKIPSSYYGKIMQSGTQLRKIEKNMTKNSKFP